MIESKGETSEENLRKRKHIEIKLKEQYLAKNDGRPYVLRTLARNRSDMTPAG